MYTLISLEMITSFFQKFNIDFTTFTTFEQSVLIVLCNIFFLLFIMFVLSLLYKIIVRLI